MDSAALLMLNEQQINLYDQIQTSQTGGHTYRDTSPMISVLWGKFTKIISIKKMGLRGVIVFNASASAESI